MIRVLDAGTVSWSRSQSLYHGLAYARTAATPDTVVLATPRDPYVCIGFHQDLEREIDLEFCRAHGIGVLRRETGGGAVYIDRDQLFVQWIFGPERLPARIDRRFEVFAQPLVQTYRELGIEAEFRPVNDIHVEGRKIVGTGAARIGHTEVVVGNFIFDFDIDVMTRVLKVPSAEFRGQLQRSLATYMTSMRRELGRQLDRGEVAARYVRNCGIALGTELVPGALCGDELGTIEAVERKLESEEFLHRAGGMHRVGVKIHQDVHVVESVLDAGGGAIRVTARTRAGRLEEVAVTDERRVTAGDDLDRVARALCGVELRADPVANVFRTLHESRAIGDAPGVAAWTQAILELSQNP